MMHRSAGKARHTPAADCTKSAEATNGAKKYFVAIWNLVLDVYASLSPFFSANLRGTSLRYAPRFRVTTLAGGLPAIAAAIRSPT
jgi:hypothetical protein